MEPLSLLSRFWRPLVAPVRTRYYASKLARGPLVRRFGYEDPVLEEGLMPHVFSKRKLPHPDYRPKLAWIEKRALFGQNDYVDILGDDQICPTKLLYNVPYWLRGFKGNEYQMLIRRKKVMRPTVFPIARPTKWMHIMKRANYLYRFLNRKTKTGMHRQ